MTDRELLEMAAKAAGIEYDEKVLAEHKEGRAFFGLWLVCHGEPYEGQRRYWNPLTDDGDAFRLAARLRLSIRYEQSFPPCECGSSVYVKAYIGWRKPDHEVNHSFARPSSRPIPMEEDAKFAEYMCRPERNEERWLPNECIATRRAIVRAAAAIGEATVTPQKERSC